MLKKLIDIFWSNITNQEVIEKTWKYCMEHQIQHNAIERYLNLMKEVVADNKEIRPLLIIEPYGDVLERLEPDYFCRRRALFYQEQ